MRTLLVTSFCFASGCFLGVSDSLQPPPPSALDFKDDTGTWRLVAGAKFKERGPQSKVPVEPPKVDLDTPPPDLGVMGELPLMLMEGQVYQLDVRDYRPFPPGVSLKGGATEQGQVPSDAAELDTIASSAPGRSLFGKMMIATDNRVLRKGTTWPYPPQGVLETSLGSCSAIYIGWDTAITAAHCFYGGGQYGYFERLVPGVDTSLSNPFPYGEQHCVTAVGIPSGFPGSSGHPAYDYAVMTFHACAERAGWSSGHFGWWINPPESALTLSGKFNIFGYPSSCARSGFIYGRPCGKSATGKYYRNSISGAIDRQYIVSDTIFTSGGQSGTGYYVYDPADQQYWTVGAHKALASGHTLDSAFWSLVQSVSQEY